MIAHLRRLAGIGVLVLSATAAVAGTAAAHADPGTFTRITSPEGPVYDYYDPTPGASNQFGVSGTASSDIAAVDIECLATLKVITPVSVVAVNVPVEDDGSFSTIGTVADNLLLPCRLRALPHNYDPRIQYLGSFSGPSVYWYTFLPEQDGAKTIGAGALSESGTGVGWIGEQSSGGEVGSLCAVATLATVTVPGFGIRGPGINQCAFALPPGNLANTASAIRVDGASAFLPGGVKTYLRGNLGYDLPQPSFATIFSRTSDGHLRLIEKARLKRCVDNAYPPTPASCASLVNTGVTFERTLDLVLGSHQVRVHDAFISTDGAAHRIRTRYRSTVAAAPSGAPGYNFPGHGTSFHQAVPGKVVTGFGRKPAATVLVRSDIYASADDDEADTQALTWMRPPDEIRFAASSVDTFEMPYTLHAPADGAAHIAFAESEAPGTAAATALAAKAIAAL